MFRQLLVMIAGMKIEIDRARCKSYKVRYFSSDCMEVDPRP